MAFGFFVLVFTGVIWLTQAVQLIDTVVASGQSVATFLTFSVLVLPKVFAIVLPLSAIAATLYAFNKFYSDSELIIMTSAGMSPIRLLRPVLIFSALVTALMYGVLIKAIPISAGILENRSKAIQSDLASSLFVERQFVHPMNGLTLFISDTIAGGRMAGIFLNDQRDPDRTVTYSAETAQFLRNGDEARLVMRDGVAITSHSASRSLNTITFAEFAFDLSDLLRDESRRTLRPSEYQVAALLEPTPEMLDSRFDRGNYISEGHYKLSLPLIAFCYPMVAMMIFMAGGYRRSGLGRRIVVSIGVALLLLIGFFRARSVVDHAPDLWPVMYLPQLAALALVVMLIAYMDRRAKPSSHRGMTQ